MADFTTAGSMRDGVYRPILRPRRGELAALSHLAPEDATRIMPIFELEPGPSIVPLIRELPPRTGVVAIDFSALPDWAGQSEGRSAARWAGRSAARSAARARGTSDDPASLDGIRPGRASLDRTAPERAPEVASPDLATPDLATPDLATPDLVARDLASCDLAWAGRTSPNLAPLDLAARDLASCDLSWAGRTSPDLAPLDLAEELADLGVAMLPVLRAYDSRRRLAAHGLAARIHLRRAVLRLQPHVDAGNPAEANEVTARLLRGAGLEVEEVDLLIDLAETACVVHADTVEEQCRRVLRWARGRPWRSVSVASGAMPPNLDDLPTDRAVSVGRLDARVWARLGEPGVGYADYGVTSPVRRHGVQRRRQLPTLRYTTDEHWWIYRWARRGGRSDDRCHDLCRTLVTSPHWPGSRFSWGDAEIARRSRTARGGGSPASWMSWSTSHHLAHVVHAQTIPDSVVRLF